MTAPSEAVARAPGPGVCYVYGIVPEETAATADLRQLKPVGQTEAGEQVRFVRHRGTAAVISEVSADRPLGRPNDLRAHAQILDTLASGFAPVLPFRFGAVLRDEQAVADELLAPYHDDFLLAMEDLAGHAQFSLRARYELDTVLAEVLEEQPEVQRLREELRGLSEEAGYYQRIRLGEIVDHALAAKRQQDAAEIEQRLAPLAVAVTFSEPSTGEGVADAAFLVEQGGSRAFEKAAEGLARHWRGRVRCRLLGPLAPYDFAPGILDELTKEA
jgi:hypothetical protein